MTYKRGTSRLYISLMLVALIMIIAIGISMLYTGDFPGSTTGRVAEDIPNDDNVNDTTQTPGEDTGSDGGITGEVVNGDNETEGDSKGGGGGGGGGGGNNGGDGGNGGGEENKTLCADTIDNDADGFCDTILGTCSDGSLPGDPMCIFPTDTTETAACQDGLDNDGDALIDFFDSGCADANDNDEYNSPPNQDGCENPDLMDDQYYLYSNTSEIDVTIFTKPDGNESFTVSTLGGTLLRKYDPANDSFYSIPGGVKKPTVSYDISETCGGVDIRYTIVNNQNVSTLIPKAFIIQGIVQDFSQQANILYDNDYGGMITMYNNDGSLNNSYLGLGGAIDQMKYPGVYSPVIVTQGTSFSAGSSLEYPYLLYRHAVLKNLDRAPDGTWIYKYDSFIDEETDNSTKLAPGESRTYTISLRFSRPDGDYWIFTLSPYKNYFNSLYGPYKDIPARDLRPIRGMQMASASDGDKCSSYERWYCNSTVGKYPLLSLGWEEFLRNFTLFSSDKGFTRTMIWTPSGVYDNAAFNFPPQFMDFLPILKTTDIFFNFFSQRNLQLGFWWGRSLTIPYKTDGSILGEDDWEASRLEPVDFLNSSHIGYLERELDLALRRGTTIFGMDAFTGGYEKYYWLDQAKQYAQDHYGRKIYLVGEASQSDLFHSKMGNYYSPCKHVFLNGPDILSYYLNPQAEIWVQFGANFKDEQGEEIFICPENYTSSSIEEIQKHIKQGYTLVMKNFQVKDTFPIMGTDITDFNEYQCLDHKDNDGDGAVDWPFDNDCSSFEDDSE